MDWSDRLEYGSYTLLVISAIASIEAHPLHNVICAFSLLHAKQLKSGVSTMVSILLLLISYIVDAFNISNEVKPVKVFMLLTLISSMFVKFIVLIAAYVQFLSLGGLWSVFGRSQAQSIPVQDSGRYSSLDSDL